MPGVTTFSNPPAKRARRAVPTVAYGSMDRKTVKRGDRRVIFELGSVRRRYRGAVGPNNDETMPLVGYYVLALEDGRKPERREFDNLTDARRLYTQAASFEHNPRKGTRARPRANPPGVRGRLISKRVLEIKYKHNDDGKWYRHTFKAGTCAALLSDGTVVLYQQDGKPVARDF